jgi:predicted O-methyltransferase YrrM
VNQVLRAAAIGIRNILIGANLRSLSKLASPRQLAFYSTQTLFFYDSLFRNGLPVKNVKEVLPHSDYTEISLFLGTDEFWINDVPSGGSDLVSLCLITRLVRPRRIFEIGTYRGYTALQFAANAPEAEIFTLDLPQGSTTLLPITVKDKELAPVEKGETLKGRKDAAKIHRLLGDSASFDFSPYAKNIDLFFIDGAHTYEYVKNDTLKALECCHSGSVIMWHDYGRRGVNGVSRWLNEFVKSHFPVYRVPNGSLAFGIVQ